MLCIIHKPAWSQFQICLSKQMQSVKFGGYLPKLESTCVAVLQESILGPLLFSICNNGLRYLLNTHKFICIHIIICMLHDDTLLHCYGTDLAVV